MTTNLKTLCACLLTTAMLVVAIPADSYAQAASEPTSKAPKAPEAKASENKPDTKPPTTPASSAPKPAASAAIGDNCPADKKFCVYGRKLASEDRIEVSLGEYVILMTNKPLADYLAKQKDRTTNKLGLFINDLYIKDIAPMAVPDRPNAVMFQLKRTSNNQDAWSEIFAHKGFWNGKREKCAEDENDRIQIAVGFEDGTLESEQALVCLEYFPNPKSAGGLLIFALSLIGMTVLFASRASLLRDPGIPPPGHKTPWSLARVQMALWTITVICSVLFIYAVSGDNPTIPDGVLVLMGIGAGTAVSAFAIDSTQQPPGNKADYEALLHAYKNQTTLAQDAEGKRATANAGGNSADIATAEERLDAATTAQQATRAKMKPFEAPASKSFIFDMLSDENGVAFHRLQLLGWTMTYWFMLVAAVMHKITLINFAATQLALMGISGATYLGFKLSEKPKDPGTGPQAGGAGGGAAPKGGAS